MKALVLEAQWEPRAGYPVSEWEKETRKAITGSSVWRHPRLEVRECPDPVPLPDQVLLEVQACGVCGSDMHFYETDADGYILYPGLTRFPSILGHEFSARVVEAGRAVKGLKPGDPVTVEEMIWCGECTPCRNGFPNHCTELEEIGFTVPGAFARYIAVGARYCWNVSDLLERFGEEKGYEVAALTEPTCVAYHAMFTRAGGFKPGAYVCVFGAGSIGLAAVGLARAAGASRLAVFEVSPVRRELASRLGADLVLDPREVRPREALMDLTHGEGCDFFVEAAGVPQLTVPEMEGAMAINAKIVQIGRAAERVPMYLESFQVRRGQFFGSQGHSGHANFPSVIRMLASGRLDLHPVITARYALDDVVQAIGRSTERRDGKILVRPNA